MGIRGSRILDCLNVGTLRIAKYIVWIGLVLASISPLYAHNHSRQVEQISMEREQQFTYYWYAAYQAMHQERFDEALVLFEFCHWLNPEDASTLGFLGIIYDATHQKERALQTLKRAYELSPIDNWESYYRSLLNLRTEEGMQTALQVVEQTAKGDTKDEELLEQLWRMYVSHQQWQKAIQTQKRIDKIKGYDAYSALNYYRTYAMWGKNRKALEAIKQYLELDPNNLQFLLFKLELVELMGVSNKELFALYDKILSIDPNNLGVLNNYAYNLAIEGGDLKHAERMSEYTIKAEPNNPIYLDTYGWILHLQGEDSLALFYLRQAKAFATEEDIIRVIDEHINAVE